MNILIQETSGSHTPRKIDFQVVLDLDQTLIYSTVDKPTSNDSNYFKVRPSDMDTDIYVYKRPYLDQFLKFVNSVGEVSIYTASQKSYADPIIDRLDSERIVTRRFYRDHCKKNEKGELIKDMSVVSKDLRKMVIIDDVDSTYKTYRNNTIRVEQWHKNKKNDTGLLDVQEVLE